jgi:hypothetical protein
MGFGKMVVKLIEQNPQLFKRVVTSTPTPVDVSADGMRKKSKALKGTTVSYSGIKTSSQGLLTGVKTEKKTLLGG